MKRKHMAVALLALASCFAVSADAFAGQTGTIKVNRDRDGTDAYSGTSAGEFKVVAFTGLNVPPLGNNVLTGGTGLFQTFCVEFNEDIAMAKTYDWELNTAAVGGGVTGGNPDPLDARTAYLFSQFWKGTLSDYEYTDLGDQVGERGWYSEQLQRAIWYLEGEVSSLTGYSQAQTWVNEATTAISDGDWSGIGNVRVLNVTSIDATTGAVLQRQDLLVLVPLPPAAFAGFLLLGGMGVIRRRRRRKELLSS